MINNHLTWENTMSATTEATTSTHPAWCSLDHGREPASTHHGVIQLGPDSEGVEVHFHESPDEGRRVILAGVGAADAVDDGFGLSLNAELTAELGRVLATC